MAAFKYAPLRDIGDHEPVRGERSIEESEKIVDGAWEIRLIRLLPSKSRVAPIECELLYRTFKSVKGNYEALSYVWVDSTGTEGMHQLPSHVTLDGQPFDVTPNLHAALRRLRDASHHRTLWIDQICINQADIWERNRQVERMTLIYGYAKRTVVWLGEEAHESFRAILLLRGLARVAKERNYEALLAAVTGEFSDVSKWKALDLLFQRAWWQRTWVVQECAVTNDVILVCGYRNISWKDLISAVISIQELQLRRVMVHCLALVSLSPVIALHQSRLRVAARGHSANKTASESIKFDSLLDVLARYRSRQATNARDKVYALLRLAQDFRDIVSTTSTNPIPIDYAKSVEEVYHDVAVFLLASSQRLDFLSHCRPKRNLANLPTWIPDWSDIATAPYPLRSALYTTTPSNSTATAQITVGRFTAQALLFDRIQALSATCTDADFSTLESAPPTFLRWQELALQSSRHDETDFIRTILTDRFDGDRLDQHSLASITASFHAAAVRASATDDASESAAGATGFAERISFLGALRYACLGRRFFVSEKGTIGLAPAETEAGDVLVAFQGARVPFAVRMGEGGEDVLVGECYVHGCMDEELDGELGLEGKGYQTITLI
ncbi:HET-domain-containing protein [Glonium stellatum]|uniref:HET-domain-containing protein n=1 Tax=Glonium stellatum TaxID=574774 RepID=A0A8E2ERT2_9PEZI|nr:HET-domain-containing protein [Glonium stellatum]